MEHGVVLAPEVIGHIGNFPITNTLLVSWMVMAVLVGLAYLVRSRLALVPTSNLQNISEIVIEGLYGLTSDLAHSKAKTIFPIVMTFFLLIMAANWFGLLPGFGTIGFYSFEEGKQVFIPLLRSLNSDLNSTLALALISVVVTHALSIKYLGLLGYIKKWVSLNPIILFVGLLELFSEFTKIISLSFRLFGNIFAGEAVLATISSVFAFVAPLPFYFLEIIVGVVQAAVFTMLTLVFMVLLTEKHDQH